MANITSSDLQPNLDLIKKAFDQFGAGIRRKSQLQAFDKALEPEERPYFWQLRDELVDPRSGPDTPLALKWDDIAQAHQRVMAKLDPNHDGISSDELWKDPARGVVVVDLLTFKETRGTGQRKDRKTQLITSRKALIEPLEGLKKKKPEG